MKKNIKSFALFSLLTITSFSLVACGSEDQSFYMANYDSYISSDLLSGLQNNNFYSSTIDDKNVSINNFRYRTYATNEDLERNFSTNYDLAVPTTYLAANLANEGKLSVIDWSKFGLYKIDSNGNQSNDLIQNAVDALTLFTPHVRAELLSFNLTKAFQRDKISLNNQKAGLLNYCVPYFLQDLIFGYKDNKSISFESDSNYWNTITQKLINSINSDDITKTAIVEDYATIYGIGRTIQTNNLTSNAGKPVDSNGNYENSLISETSTHSQEDFAKTYNEIFKNLNKKNAFYLNPDSNNILNDFASPVGSQAVISYNGDLLFSFQGGDNYGLDTTSEKTINESMPIFKEWLLNNINENNQTLKLNIEKPTVSQIYLDVMVLNKDRIEKYNHQDEAYAILKKVGLEGSDQTLYTYNETDTSKISGYDENSIIAVDERDNYSNGPMLNFSYVQYSSPLLTLNAYALNSASSSMLQTIKTESESAKKFYESKYPNLTSTDMDLWKSLWDQGSDGYFASEYSVIEQNDDNENGFLSSDMYKQYIDKLTSIYNISEYANPNFLGRNLSDLNKSNMYYAFSQVKYNQL